jgi:glycosyltransferase involved in cell wall biosynthesis
VALRFPSARQRITAVPEGIDERFSPVKNPSGESAWQRYLGLRPPYFLYLGQWKAYKNLALLVQAFQRVLTTQPNLQLVIAGSDPRNSELRRVGAALPVGSIVFPGYLPEDAVPDVYRGAKALVLASHSEGFGLPVLEAMACGIPVVCSDIPALREIADGVAIFCDPASAESFAAGMLQAIGEAAAPERVGLGLERARQYSWAKAAGETVAIYERALAGRARTRADID